MKIYNKTLDNLSYFFCEYAFRMAGDSTVSLPKWHCPKWWNYTVNKLSNDSLIEHVLPSDADNYEKERTELLSNTITERLAQRWFSLMYKIGCYCENLKG